jgi:hypothetical protein
VLVCMLGAQMTCFSKALYRSSENLEPERPLCNSPSQTQGDERFRASFSIPDSSNDIGEWLTTPAILPQHINLSVKQASYT